MNYEVNRDPMTIIQNPNLANVMNPIGTGFKSFSGKTETGNSKDYRTPFYRETMGKVDDNGEKKSPPREDVLSSWLPQLDSLKRKFPGLWKYEMEMAGKVGPLSIQKPLQERWPSIHEYWKDILLPSKPIPDEAINAVLKWAGSAKGCMLRSEKKTVEAMKLSTNSGAPYFTRRRIVLDDALGAKLGWDVNYDSKCLIPCYWDNKDRYWEACAILGWRGQEGGPSDDQVKQRDLFMFPLVYNIAELRGYQPLKESAQKHNLFPGWVSWDAVDENITNMFKTKGKRNLIVCTDFTKFDHHFNADMQVAAKKIISGLFQRRPDVDEWLEYAFPIKYQIPLLCGEDTMIYGHHGMASGSGGTNDDESWAHKALQFEAAITDHQRLNPYSTCLGDDGILTYPGISVDHVIETYTSHGQDMNPDKQEVSTHECTFLRRWYDEEYRINGINRGVYATTRAIGRLCGQERFYDEKIWGPKMVTLRYLSIIENCRYHPLFHEFVDWCMKGDKYRLGTKIPGFYANLTKIAREATDIMPDFLGYTNSNMHSSSGISQWATVKYIMNNYDCMK